METIHPALQKRFFNLDPERCQVWSNGGGVQSCYIATLILQGVLPKPRYAVMVNTEREKGNVFAYQEKHVRPALEKFGIECHYPNKSDFTDVDCVGGKKKTTILLPVFTNQSGEVGKFRQFCTGEWKLNVRDKMLTRIKAPTKRDVWLGISWDEMSRVKLKDNRRGDNSHLMYPLVALQKSRNDCILGIALFGWPPAPRSACWCCPNQCDNEWAEMKKSRPDDFEQAVALDYELRETDPNVFLHQSCLPLDKVDFTAKISAGFFSGSCPSGVCFT